MSNEWENKSLEELEKEFNRINSALTIQRRKYYRDGNPSERAKAQDVMEQLKSEKKKIEKAKRRHKPYRIPLTNKITSVYEIDVGSKKYYGESFKKVAPKAIGATLAVAGVAATFYGIMWNAYQQYLQDNEKKHTDSSQTEEATRESTKPFWDTTEGREIQKYSAIYGVDPNLAMNVYLNRDELKLDDYCQAYNIKNKKYDDIFITSNDHTQVTKGICGQLAQVLESSDGNVVGALAFLEQGYDNVTDLIKTIGINIASYSDTVNSQYFNTPLVQKILGNCPTELTNYYYDDGEISVKTLSLQTGEESKSTFVDDVNDMKINR